MLFNCLSLSDDKNLQVVKVCEAVKSKKQMNLVDNVFGVEFNRLLESIKKSTSGDVGQSYTEKTDLSPQTKTKLDNDLALLEETKKKAKFDADLRAFQVNRRLKSQRMSRSAILKVAQIEFENYRDKLTSENEEENSDEFR